MATNTRERPYAEYLPGNIDELNKYISEAEVLTKQIMNSPTEVTWTGTAYYVSNNGDDNNDGKTPETAWKSAEKIKDPGFLLPGDAVLFERGGKFRYTDAIYAGKGVTYSAYGDGAKPLLIGSLDASHKDDWRATEYVNVYAYTGEIAGQNVGGLYDVGLIVFDHGRAWGIKMLDKQPVGVVSNGLECYDAGSRDINNAGDLKNDLEFWHDTDAGILYVYSKEGSPADRFFSVEIVDGDCGFRCMTNTGITIDNLAFFGFGIHGVASYKTEDLTIQNCTFSFIGGSASPVKKIRLGNAVEVYGACENFIIRNCYAEQVYDCCWTAQWSGDSNGVDMFFKNVEFYNNVCYYSNTGLEVWLSNDNPANGATFGISNMHLHHNYTLFNGYGWSHQRPNKDANNFYGSSHGIVFENCSVDHNVGIFTSANVIKAGSIGSSEYNFNNNIYFQDPGKYIGGIPYDPEKGGVFFRNVLCYEKDTMEMLIKTGFESGTKFYYMRDYEVPMAQKDIVRFDK